MGLAISYHALLKVRCMHTFGHSLIRVIFIEFDNFGKVVDEWILVLNTEILDHFIEFVNCSYC